jgi:Fic family protein
MHQYIWQQKEWPKFSWDSEKLLVPLSECRLAQGRLISRVAGLGITMGQQAQAEILIEEIIKTSAIEGELLDARSVRSSVARRLGIPTAGLPVDRRIDDLVSVLLDATMNCSTSLTAERLWGWQAALFPTGYSGLHKIQVGQWRSGDEPMRVISGPIGREKIHYEAPPSSKLQSEMDVFLNWWHARHSDMEGIIRAAVTHFWFVTIHPFDDGNGRIARALTDMALAQDDKQNVRTYSLSAQIMADREEYYDILEKCQKGTCDITAWLLWFLGCFTRAIRRSEDILDGVFTRSEFWRRHDHLQLSDRQKKVINRLLEEGPGGFEGGLTTKKYASMTHTSKGTAFRELDQLFEWKILERCGKGRSVHYQLPARNDGQSV